MIMPAAMALKEKDRNFEGSDVREGLTVILSLGIPENLLQFEGQTKGKLGTAEAKSAVENLVSEKLTYFLEENKDLAFTLIKKMSRAFQAREAARKAREDLRKGKSRGKSEKILSGKLAAAQSKDARKKSYIWSRVILPAAVPSRGVTHAIRRFCRCAVRC